MESSGPIAIGDILEGKYLVEGELGEGAMGVVYAGRHQALNKRVAIKTLRAEIAREAEIVGRFEQEARAASAIGHPNIIQVFDLGTAPSGVRFMVMEHLDGHSLGELLAERPILDPERAVAIVRQVLSALNAAHKRGIVHRDLKPENIYLTRSEENPEFVKLLDFGISKVLEIADPNIAGADSAARATRMGTVMGTPLYMSPEQARGDVDVDHRVDIWAVGCVLYEMLCGRTPFTGDNYNQILLAILSDRYPRPTQLRPAITPALEAVIARAMAQDRNARFDGAAEMRAALDAAFGGRAPGLATPPTGMAVTAAEEADALELDEPAAGPAAVPGLADSQTGLAAAASAGRQNEAELLDALSRLAAPGEGAAADEDMLAAVATEAPPPPPAMQERAPVARAPRAAATGGDEDLFAPPEAESEELSLSLGDRDVAPRRQLAAEARAAPVRRTTAAEVRAPATGGGLGGALKLLVLIALLGAGGFAGYRYAVHGYLLTPPEPKTVAVALSVLPESATIAVNGAPVQAGTLQAEVGQQLVIEFRAKGRLSARRSLVVESGKPVTLSLRLPHEMRPIDPRSVPRAGSGLAKAADDPPATALDEAIEKLAEVRRCLEPLTVPMVEGQSQYLATGGRSGRIDRRHIPTVSVLPEETITACRMVLRGAGDIEPAMPRIDAMAGEHMRVVDELVELTRRLEKYYRDREYEIDKFGLGKRLHIPLVKTYTTAVEGHGELIAEVGAQLIRANALELDAVSEAEGKGEHWQLRNVLLASHAWLWAELARAPRAECRARRAALQKALEGAAAVVGQQGGAAVAVEGARACFEATRGLGELASAAETGKLDLDSAIERHNQSVGLFNALIL